MVEQERRVFVVLGMHRSGTSAVTRALSTLGVDLGDRLMPPSVGDNDKGFYEDLDIYALNVRMLKAIGSDWHRLAPITPEDVSELRDKGFLISALDLLRQKTAGQTIFGFKDPRVAKLLPFWEQIFHAGGFKVSYLLVVRNPLSVAYSLKKREGFHHERTYALWIEHVISSLAISARNTRVLIDFDLFVRAPEQQLTRIATALELKVNAAAMNDYLARFLDENLRHYKFSMDELLADEACTPLLRQMYTTLFEYAAEGRPIDTPIFYDITSRWAAEFSHIQQTFGWIDRILQHTAEMEQAVQTPDQQLRSIIQSAIAADSRIFADVFDKDWYLRKHPDVAVAGIDAYQHYLDAGLAEGRAPAADTAAFVRDGLAFYMNKLKSRLNQANELKDEHAKQSAKLAGEMTAKLHQQKQDFERQFRERQELLELYKAHSLHMQQQLEKSEKREVLLTTQASSAREAHDEQVASLQRVVDQTLAELDALRTERRDILRLQEAVAFGERTLAQLQSEYVAQEGRLAEIYDRFASLFSVKQDEPVAAARSVDELLQYHANQFVECAYMTLLKRAPDAHGRQFYLSRVMSGTPKLQVLKELFESDEAQTIGVQLAGLPEALKRYRLAKNPIRRLLSPSLASFDLESADQNRLRAIEQKLFAGDQSAMAINLPFVFHDAGKTAELKSNTPHPERFEAPAVVPDLIPSRAGNPELPPADGKWEWGDYVVVKDRIADFKRSRADSFVPKPIELIDIGERPFTSVLQDIALPAPGKTPDVSIILPVFNNLKLTLECLLSISRYAETSVTFEVLVRDDASSDDTVKVVTAIKNLRLVRNPENLGFLKNCNRAIDSVRGRYVVFLNNDVQVSKGWLSALLDTFSKFPKVGAVGPRYVYPNGRLQEVGAAFRPDMTAQMIGLGEDPEQLRFAYVRRVDYTSGACLMLPTPLLKELDGFSEDFLPCYCEDSDLCLRVQERGYFVYCNAEVTVVHHLSKTTAALNDDFKYRCVAKNLNTLAQKWAHRVEKTSVPRVLAFYLPQFHPFPENNAWWGEGFTEWTNVTKARPNYEGHYQPRFPADLGYYDLRLPEIMAQQAHLARSHGIDGFCFYYYWFGGKRLLETPIEAMLASKTPDFPFCLCWANENWSRRWDGRSSEILMAQQHSPDDDIAVIGDLVRYFADARYIRVDGRPLMLIYRVQLFPNFAETAERWRSYCRETGVGEIYLAMVESFELVHSRTNPTVYGCDAAVEFPPQELADAKSPSGVIINPDFTGSVADYRDLAVKFATRDLPNYKRFLGVAPGWDNTARMQHKSFCFEYATPGAFQAWLEEAIELTRTQHYGDERLVFVNAWNEWAEGAYLEPDQRFGHAFLEAVRNAKEAALLLRRNAYGLGG